MKKLKKDYFIGAAIIVIMAISLVLMETPDFESKSEASKIETVKFDKENFTEISNQQLISGDFSDLSGKWTNVKGIEKANIEGTNFFYNGQKYVLRIGGLTAQELAFVKTISENGDKNSANLYYYPAGTIIPVLQKDGSALISELADPTDNSRDRLLFAASNLTANEIERSVIYRK